MVLREERGPVPAPNPMTTSPKRSNRFQPKFPLPPLKWGQQRFLRCSNNAAAAAGSSGSGDRSSPMSDESATRRERERSPGRGLKRRHVGGGGGCDDGDGGIAVVRRKLMHDLKTEADRMKDAILGNGKEHEEEEGEAARPWNLRARPDRPSGEKNRDCSSPARIDGGAAVRVPKLRSEIDKTTAPPRREKFSLQLTKAEIEEDFMAMTGRRPRARPSKRPKPVQKKLDALFPGLWLTEVTPDLYKVNDATEKGKGKGKNKDDESL